LSCVDLKKNYLHWSFAAVALKNFAVDCCYATALGLKAREKCDSLAKQQTKLIARSRTMAMFARIGTKVRSLKD
jgi:hypothetical protein